MIEQPMPHTSVSAERTAVRAGHLIRVPVVFPRELPFLPKPIRVLWTELINCQYMTLRDVTVQGCTLEWETPEPGRSRVKATVLLPREGSQGRD